jgi:hypothetical protein
MQFAELLDDAGPNVWVVQTPPTDAANTIWIGYVNDKLALEIR